MRIIIDTEEKKIEEHLQESDDVLTDHELEMQIAYGIAALVTGQAMKNYRSEKARKMYILVITKMAKDALERADADENEDEEEDDTWEWLADDNRFL